MWATSQVPNPASRLLDSACTFDTCFHHRCSIAAFTVLLASTIYEHLMQAMQACNLRLMTGYNHASMHVHECYMSACGVACTFAMHHVHGIPIPFVTFHSYQFSWSCPAGHACAHCLPSTCMHTMMILLVTHMDE